MDAKPRELYLLFRAYEVSTRKRDMTMTVVVVGSGEKDENKSIINLQDVRNWQPLNLPYQ